MLTRLSTASAAALMLLTLAARGADVDITVNTDQVLHQVDPKVYGHFYEHIYHSANGGLWGNVVWNRSFEQSTEGVGNWEHDGEVLRQLSNAPGVTHMFGDQAIQDFDYTLQARKLGGAEGFLIPFRAAGPEDYYWLNLGGWNNTQHAIERTTRGGRRFMVGQPFPGSIETDRWYTIRIRGKGDRVQAWVDGQLFFDEIVQNDDTPVGQVGVGTYHTQAEFRNPVLKSVDGSTLHKDFPETPRSTRLAQNWDITSGHATITDENPLNDEFAAVLTSAGDDSATIEQPHVKLDDEDPLSGSIWLRADGDATVTIRALGDDGDVLAQQEIRGVTEQWQEYPVTLKPAGDAREGKLQVTARSSEPVYVDQFNLVPASAEANDGFRTDLYEALAGLQPTIIRWPGGCYAEQYKWMHGVGPQHTRRKNLTPMWEDYDPNSLGTDEFIQLCRKLGSEPLLVINTGMHVTGTSTPEEWAPWVEEAKAWVEYCNGPTTSKYGAMRAANGHPEPYNVKYWEIDNELWRSKQTDPAVYAEAVKIFAPALREVDPSITVIAHGGNALDRRYNQVVLENAAEHFDILSIHHYTDPQDFDRGVYDQEALYEDTRKQIAASKNPDIKLYVSEWNAQTTDWRTGLYAGGLLNVFERQGDFLKLAGPALLMREKTAGAWDNAFINFDQNGWYPAPNYVVMKLWREHFAPDFLALKGELEGTNIVATRSENGQCVYLKAVNPTDKPMTVAATLQGNFVLSDASMQVVAPGELSARNTFEQPQAVLRPEAAPVKAEGQKVAFELPARSAGVVTLQAE